MKKTHANLKIKLIAAILLTAMLTCFFASCELVQTFLNTERLEAPVVVLKNNIATWEANFKAKHFEINIDGELSNLENNVAAKALESGQSFKIRAIGDGINYSSSDWSNTVKFEGVITGENCEHKLAYREAKSPTCEEDGHIACWVCEKCKQYFADNKGSTQLSANDVLVAASGHNAIIDEAVAPTKDNPGLTEGSHCSVCNKVLVEQKPIDPIVEGTYSVTYNIANGDDYLAKLNIENKNVTSYSGNQAITLQNLSVPGYIFKGWFTIDGTQYTEIAKGTTGDKEFFARWEKIQYTITFDSPDVPVESVTYTVDTGKPLDNAVWYGYTFVGWSNDDGFIVSKIKPGTTGNITLHANWTSDRNKATSYEKYGAPIIIEDDASGQFLFVYNIGRIDNVPLYEISYIGNTQKLELNSEYTIIDSISSEQAEAIANSISNATTRSSGWTLSEEWNQLYSEGSEIGNLQVKTDERVDSEGNVVGGNYFVSNSSGGSTYVSTESGSSQSSSSKVTTEASMGINTSYDKSTEKYADAKLGITNTTEASAGISLPIKVAKVSAEIKNTTTVSAEAASGRKDNEAYHYDGNASSYVGTVNTNDQSSYYKSSANQSSSWNSETGYNKSYQSSHDSQISSAISAQVSKNSNYNISDSIGGNNSKTASIKGTDSETNEYSTTFLYSSGTETTTSKHVKYVSDRPGYYRLIMAGTVHVYGVVGYDVATGSYYTYTYNILDNERHEYLDYSKDNANFNDCENGVVTFEIPYEVNDYIVGVTGKTDGIEVDLEGNITGFETSDPASYDGYVTIPQYYSVNNGDGTYSAYKTKSFDAEVFRGNTEIKTVVLPIYVTEIPDGAFEGCTSLETVVAYGVNKIGSNAFKGCTSLKSFAIDNYITELGINAFEGVNEITVMAANENVAEAAINSGAKRITLNLSMLQGGYNNKSIEIAENIEYFALIGNGSVYTNLSLKSKANETFISNIVFSGNTDTPINLDSKKVTLGRVTVENAPGFAVILSSNADVKLLGDITLSSVSENVMISKDVSLSKLDSGVSGKLKIIGKYLIYGAIENQSMLAAVGGVQYIDEDTFNSMLSSITVNFDANGGSLSENSKTAYYGQYYGALPTPTSANYDFAGWFTERSGGIQITSESIVDSLANQTLYAHWTPKVFTVNFNANGGSVSTTNKTVSYGNSMGDLPTPRREYYTFNGWFTDANGGSQVTSSTVSASAQNLTLYAHWTINTFKIYFNANSGSVSTSYITVTCGQQYGTLPTPTRDYFTFDGWYTAASGGNRVDASTSSYSNSDITLYAHWTEHGVSGWVSASSVPAGAQIVNRKWTYTRTETTSSTDSALSGWTQTGSYWQQIGSGSANYATFPTGYDTSNSYYTSFNKAAHEAYNNGSTKREVTTAWAGYIYWHWMYDVAYANTTTRTISSRSGTWNSTGGTSGGYNYKYFFAIASTVNCPYLDTYYCCNRGWKSYNCHSIISNTKNVGTPRCFRFSYYVSSYIDYQMVYNYQRITNNIESYSVVYAGGEISNVQELVQYRAK